jgi:hypothetical protein
MSTRWPGTSLSLSSGAHSRGPLAPSGCKAAARRSADCPTGQFLTQLLRPNGLARKTKIPEPDQADLSCPAPLQKYSVFPKCKSGYMICHPVPGEGRWPSSRTLGRDAVDAAVPARAVIAGRIFRERSDRAQTNGAAADGKIVWS